MIPNTSDENINRKIAVILVADVVGYSKHMEKDENSTLRAYSECEQILKHLLERKQGMIFNTAGDSVLVEFSSAVNAVECAVDFQDKIEQRGKKEDEVFKVKISFYSELIQSLESIEKDREIDEEELHKYKLFFQYSLQ